MKKKNILLLLLLLILLGNSPAVHGQNVFTTVVTPLKNEKWWGGVVALGHQMPFGQQLALQDLARNNLNNQLVPCMISSAGRYIWAENPFRFEIKDGELVIYSDGEKPELVSAGTTLKEAQLAVAGKHFPSSGQIPEEVFFSLPQYNTWIELMYDQNQRDIMQYAHKVVEHGFPQGVFVGR